MNLVGLYYFINLGLVLVMENLYIDVVSDNTEDIVEADFDFRIAKTVWINVNCKVFIEVVKGARIKEVAEI